MTDRSLFKHRLALNVRHYEIDWQGIAHNANYLLYCELGRVEYFHALGAALDLNTVNGGSKIVLVRNEIDYRQPARLGDALTVLTRIRSIRTSSFVMEGVIIRDRDDQLIAENTAFHVWLDPATDRPMPVPVPFRRLVQAFEGPSTEIHWPESNG